MVVDSLSEEGIGKELLHSLDAIEMARVNGCLHVATRKVLLVAMGTDEMSELGLTAVFTGEVLFRREADAGTTFALSSARKFSLGGGGHNSDQNSVIRIQSILATDEVYRNGGG